MQLAARQDHWMAERQAEAKESTGMEIVSGGVETTQPKSLES